MKTAALSIDWLTGECWLEGVSGTRYRVSDVEKWERQARAGDAAARARLDAIEGDVYEPVSAPTESELVVADLLRELAPREGHAERRHRPNRGRR